MQSQISLPALQQMILAGFADSGVLREIGLAPPLLCERVRAERGRAQARRSDAPAKA